MIFHILSRDVHCAMFTLEAEVVTDGIMALSVADSKGGLTPEMGPRASHYQVFNNAST